MKPIQIIVLIVALVLGAALTLFTFRFFRSAPPTSAALGHDHDHGHGHGHGSEADEHEDEPARGPHGGRMLEDGDFQLEVTIFESGVPPQFRIFPYEKHQPLDPDHVQLSIQLERLGGILDIFEFQKEGDYLKGDHIVGEPHSFLVKVLAEHQGTKHEWTYESFEGRTQLSPAAIEESGIEIGTAGPREITESIQTYGRIAPNEDRLAYVIPRFPGTVRQIHKRLGDAVSQDEVLATIQSNDSLQSYEVRSPLSGVIIEKNIHPGELTQPGQAIYTVANLEEVWVELNVYPKDFSKIKLGQPVVVRVGDDLPESKGTLSFISPFGAENSQTVLARVVLDNREGFLRPGLFVSARIIIDQTTVPVAVPASALQTFRDWQVVFIQVGDIFEFRPVTTGRHDQAWVEIVEGLEPGQRYAAENSFIIKADILKSGATHDH